MKDIFLDIDRCLGCKNCEIYCAVEHSYSKDLFSAIFERPIPEKRINVEYATGMPFPVRCRHCENAPCVDACPNGAMGIDNGLVTHNLDRCIGCLMCAMVCPFGAVSPMLERKIVLKCDRCPDSDIPACVKACPTDALVFDDVEIILKKRRKEIVDLVLTAVKKEVKVGGIL